MTEGGKAEDQESGGFSRRTVFWLVIIGAASFACAVFFAIFGETVSTASSASADTFSRSAIGHHGLVELLRAGEVPVLISQHDTAEKLAAETTLVAAEPAVAVADGVRAAELRAMFDSAERAVLILPKWFGDEDPMRPTFLERAYLLPTDEVEPVLRALEIYASVVRPPGRPSWSSAAGVSLPRGGPDLVGPQLLVPAEEGALTPVVWSDAGILVGKVELDESTELWIISDPDLLSNHGLLRGDNASIALQLIEQARRGRGALVFDETMHGFKSEPSLWRVLFEFPLGLVTLQALLAVGFLLWAATGRFGKPLAGPSALAPGKEFLIDNTAALLRFAGHAGAALQRYLQTAVQDAARALHAPAYLDDAATARWLDHLAATRGLNVRLADLEREVYGAAEARSDRANRVVQAARRIHRWRQEIIHGSADGSRRR
jgi:hypothetical protein